MPVQNLHYETSHNFGEFADVNMVDGSLYSVNLLFLDCGRAACETCRIVSDKISSLGQSKSHALLMRVVTLPASPSGSDSSSTDHVRRSRSEQKIIKHTLLVPCVSVKVAVELRMFL
jgi:hypothetical protein